MKSVLSGLYHGKLDPQDIFFHDTAFRDLRGEFKKQQESVQNTLSQEQANSLSRLLDKHADLLLMLEVMQIMDTDFRWSE